MPTRPSSPEAPDAFPWPFTARDTPPVRRRIAADLQRCVAEVRAADPALRALVLTGGFARGEGTVLRGAPQNDYDLLAFRGLGRPRVPWPVVRASLERALGLHIDLQPVWTARLPLARRSIFWYETAQRGQTLWGDAALLARIPAHDPASLDRGEALRLLANRAAGLLLYEGAAAGMVRIQASKALLAALDVHLLREGAFPPSQRERWDAFLRWEARGDTPRALAGRRDWLAWAITQKVDPTPAPLVPPRDAWHAAALAVLDALPVALALAGAGSLAEAAGRAAPLDDALYRWRALRSPGLVAWAPHPTGQLQAATLRLLAERAGVAAPEGPSLDALCREPRGEPAQALARVRAAAPT